MLKLLIKDLLVFFGEVIVFLSFILPLLFAFYLILTYILFYLYGETSLIGKEILSSTNEELSYLIFLFLGISTLGNFLFNRLRKTEIKEEISFDKEEQLIFILISWLLAYYFTHTLALFSGFGWIPEILLTFILYFWVKTIVRFYLRYNLAYFAGLIKLNLFSYLTLNKEYKLNLKIKVNEIPRSIFQNSTQILSFISKINWKKLTSVLPTLLLRLTLVTGLIVSMAAIVILITGFITLKFRNYLDYNRMLRENLTIMNVIPATTTIGEKVRVAGYNFGWRFSEDDRLMSDYGPISVELWKEDEIYFTVPLHWKEGKTAIWIERMKGSIPSAPLIKSNIKELKVTNRWDFYPQQEELDRKNLFTLASRGIKKIKRFLYIQAGWLK